MENTRRSGSADENPRKRWAIVVATGCKWIGGEKRTNRRIQVPASMWPCKIEERLTLELVVDKEREMYETKITDKTGFTIRYPGSCPEFMEDRGVVWFKPRDLYAFVDMLEEEERNQRSGFASRPVPQPEGNRNGWIDEEKEQEEEGGVDSDLESTATSRYNPT